MIPPPYLKAHAHGTQLAAKIQPRAARNQIGEATGAELKIKITAPPVDSAANEALIRFLATQLHCSRGAVQIVRGQKATHKLIVIEGLDPVTVLARLESKH